MVYEVDPPPQIMACSLNRKRIRYRLVWRVIQAFPNMGVYENQGPLNIDPQIVGFPYNEDPSKVPLIFGSPPHSAPTPVINPNAPHLGAYWLVL